MDNITIINILWEVLSLMEPNMFDYYDPNKTYQMPMTKINTTETEYVVCEIKINYKKKGKLNIPIFISCTKEGYERRGFYSEFFGWLIYTKRIIEMP